MSTPRPPSTAACSAGRSRTSRRPAQPRFVMAQLDGLDRGRDRRAVRGHVGPGVEHVRQRRRTRTRWWRRSRPRAARSWPRPSTSAPAGRMAVFADPEGAQFRVWQPGRHERRAARQRPGLVELERSRDPRHRSGEGVLRRGLRLGVQRGRPRPRAERDDPRPGLRRAPRVARRPGTLESHKSMGAPDGFSDAVGWMQPPARENGAARWVVTFSVADADETAARANGARRHGPGRALRRSLRPHGRDARPGRRDVRDRPVPAADRLSRAESSRA